MKISDICKSYFSGFQEAANFKSNANGINALAALKILSYFTVVIPLGFAATYCAASLYGRFSKIESLSRQDQDIKEKAKPVFSNKTETNPDMSNPVTSQPEILSDNWGTITLKLNGVETTFKDVIILPSDGQQRATKWDWKWSAEAMCHHPGVRVNDIENLIFSKTPRPDVIILTQGRGHGGKRENPGPGILEISPGVREYIEQQGVPEIYILKTVAAIEKYNEIRSQGNKQIAALIHTTC